MAERLRTRFGGPDDSPGLLLWQVTNRWQAAQRAALAPLGLTHVQFVLLASLTWLAQEPIAPPVAQEPIAPAVAHADQRAGAVTQRDVADLAATDPMMTSQVLRALERKGLLERADHPTDGRAKAIRTTAAGVAVANRAIAVVERCDLDFFGVLGPACTELTRTLLALRDAVAAPGADQRK
ncbi:MAG: MarR family winged helix-turn-helix transcriptional regulator [Propionibacteriaceae bacterium]